MKHQNNKRILAIDPGTRYMGYAFFEGRALASCGVYRLQESSEGGRFLYEAEWWLEEAVKRYRPEVIVIERPQGRVTGEIVALRQVIQALKRVAGAKSITVSEITPATAREIITGNPWASKDEVLQAVTERYPNLKTLLAPHPEQHWHHISDAVAVGVALPGRRNEQQAA